MKAVPGTPPQAAQTVLHTRGLAVDVDGAPVLREVSVDIPAGSCTAVLGPNGSGKTTFLRAVLGLTPTASGSVNWFGQAGTRTQGGERVTLVPQLLPGSTPVPVSVTEFVESAFTSPRNRWRRWSMRGQRAQAVARAVAQVDLGHKAQQPIDALSGGEQRRALFARAIATGADVILLDEPLAGVDVEHQAGLVAILRDMRASGATLVIVAHELDAIAALVDHVVVFGGSGRSSVVYEGAPSSAVLGRHLHHEPHHEHELVRPDTALMEM